MSRAWWKGTTDVDMSITFNKAFLDEASQCQLVIGSYEAMPDCCNCDGPSSCKLGLHSSYNPIVSYLRQHPSLAPIRQRHYQLWRSSYFENEPNG